MIDVFPQTESQLKAKAQAEGVSVQEYLERLMRESESRRTRFFEFRQGIDERLQSLSAGENVDGEVVMARLIAELDPPDQQSGRR